MPAVIPAGSEILFYYFVAVKWVLYIKQDGTASKPRSLRERVFLFLEIKYIYSLQQSKVK